MVSEVSSFSFFWDTLYIRIITPTFLNKYWKLLQLNYHSYIFWPTSFQIWQDWWQSSDFGTSYQHKELKLSTSKIVMIIFCPVLCQYSDFSWFLRNLMKIWRKSNLIWFHFSHYFVFIIIKKWEYFIERSLSPVGIIWRK